MNKKLIVVSSFCFLLMISHIVLIIQVMNLKNVIENLGEKTLSFEKNLEDYKDKNNTLIKDIHKELELMNVKTNEQFLKTVGMSKTYDAILKEQKNKTIDTAEKDTAIIEAKNKALVLYKKGKYSEAYEEFKKITQTNTDDMESRCYKAKSRYYQNRADSSSYQEILSDITILKQNSAADDEIINIEKTIFAEKEGINE